MRACMHRRVESRLDLRAIVRLSSVVALHVAHCTVDLPFQLAILCPADSTAVANVDWSKSEVKRSYSAGGYATSVKSGLTLRLEECKCSEEEKLVWSNHTGSSPT